MSRPRYDIVIIGSGLGGLLTAALLSKEGKSVCILEKNRIPGGCLQSFSWKERIFNTGIHYFGGLDEGKPLHRYWKYLGLTNLDCFEKIGDEAFDMISFQDKEFPLAPGKQNFVDRLLPFFPKSGEILNGYVQTLEDITSRISLYNLDVPKNEFSLEKSMNAWRFFNHFPDETSVLPKVLSGNNFIYGGSRSDTPLYLAAVINHSFISGAWRISGGSSRIADHLVSRLQSAGGELFPNQEVKGITKHHHGFSIKTASGEIFEADQVISAIHPSDSLKMINGTEVRQVFSDRIQNLENTPSALALFIALKPGSFRHFPYKIHHFPGHDTWYEQDFSDNEHFMLYTNPDANGAFATGAVVLTRDSMKDYAAWADSTAENRPGEYREYKKQKAERLLGQVENKFPGFRQHIEDFNISTPLTWKD
ncbi:MAG: phytoene desaturase family protein, partial [Syntrophothermus sp.]